MRRIVAPLLLVLGGFGCAARPVGPSPAPDPGASGPDVPREAVHPVRYRGFTSQYAALVGSDAAIESFEATIGPAVAEHGPAFEKAFGGALEHYRTGDHPLRRYVDRLSPDEEPAVGLEFHELASSPFSPQRFGIDPADFPEAVALHFQESSVLLQRIVWRQFVASQFFEGGVLAGPDAGRDDNLVARQWEEAFDTILPLFVEIVARGGDPSARTSDGIVLYRIGRELGPRVSLTVLHRRYVSDPQAFAKVAEAPLPKPVSKDEEYYLELSHGIGFLVRMKLAYVLFSGSPLPPEYFEILDRPDLGVLQPGLDLVALVPDEQWAAHQREIVARLAAWTADDLSINGFIDASAVAALGG